MIFYDRNEAGRKLASALGRYSGPNAVVYGIPRGGVIVAKWVADTLGLPLDVAIVRKIGHPASAEYAIAAVAESGDLVMNQVEVSRVDQSWFQEAVEREKGEAMRRRKLYRPSTLRPSVHGRTAILVDDGTATGLTVEAAIRELRRECPCRLVVAVPVASQDAVDRLEKVADEVIVLDSPAAFMNAVGSHYAEFPQVTDEEVQAALWTNASFKKRRVA